MSTDPKINKLKDLIKIANDGLDRQSFENAFKKVIEQVFKVETKLIEKANQETQKEKQALNDLKQEFYQVIEEAKSESDNSLSGFKRKTTELINSLLAKSKVNQKLSEVLNNVDYKLQQIDDKMASVRSGVDGFDGQDADPVDEEAIVDKVLKKVEVPEIDDDILDELRADIEELKARPTRLGGGGFSKMHMEQKFVDDETPSGTVNSTNKNFTILSKPNPTGSLKVFVNGQRMRITEDYTFSGVTITFITAPPTNSIILCDYRK